MNSELEHKESRNWYYEEKGKRHGPVTEPEIIERIKAGILTYGSGVWTNGFSEWQKIETTDLKAHLGEMSPPPLQGDHINNSMAWVLAFAPIIGFIIQYIIALVSVSSKLTPQAMEVIGSEVALAAVASGKWWYVTLGLQALIADIDERRLKKAGHNTDYFSSKNFRWWKIIAPVYLFQRAKALNQSLAYFWVWIGMFVLTLLG